MPKPKKQPLKKSTKKTQEQASPNKRATPPHPIGKRYLFSTIGVVVVLSLLFIWQQRPPNSEIRTDDEELLSYEELVSADTDGDGVEDWRELLLGTSPSAFDTNNDGVDDGRVNMATQNVVTLMRLNRLRRENPDLSEEEINQLSRESLAGNIDDLTVTEQTAQELYMAATLIEGVAELTPEIENDIVQRYLNALIYEYVYPILAEPDFIVSSTYSPDDVDIYLEEVLLLTQTNIIDPDPLLFFENYLETGNAAGLEKGIDESLLKLVNIITAMRERSVPIIFIDQHVELINGYIRVAVDLDEMKAYEDDALAGYAAFLRYRPNVITLSNAIAQFAESSIAYYE